MYTGAFRRLGESRAVFTTSVNILTRGFLTIITTSFIYSPQPQPRVMPPILGPTNIIRSPMKQNRRWNTTESYPRSLHTDLQHYAIPLHPTGENKLRLSDSSNISEDDWEMKRFYIRRGEATVLNCYYYKWWESLPKVPCTGEWEESEYSVRVCSPARSPCYLLCIDLRSQHW